jgi:copper chaperone
MEQMVRFKIEGMHCDGCVRRVTRVLQALAGVGVESVSVGSAAVVLDPAKVSAEQVVAAVNGIGFTARAEQERTDTRG